MADERLPIPQYQIDEIVSSVKTSVLDAVSKGDMSGRFAGIAEKSAEINADLKVSVKNFQDQSIKNQEEITNLLDQIVESLSQIYNQDPCQFESVCKEINEILHGDEYKLKEQVRDLKESGFAKKVRNLAITIATLVALSGLSGAIGGLIIYQINKGGVNVQLNGPTKLQP